MSEDNNDRTPTPPALIPPPVRGDEQDAVSPLSDEVQPESPTAPDAEPTQSEIAAEQAEASLDARDEGLADDAQASDEFVADELFLDEPVANAPISRDPLAEAAMNHEPDTFEHAATEPEAPEPVPYDQHDDSFVYESSHIDDEDRDQAGATAVIPAAVAVAAAGPVAAASPPGSFSPAPEAYPAQQPPAPQRAFTSPPVAPKKKGNRVIGALIAVASVVVFLIVFAIVAAIAFALGAPGQNFLTSLTASLANPLFYVPAVFFVIGFVLVVLVANRANWWAYILGSLFVAAVVYFGTITVGLLISNVVVMTPNEAAAEFAQSATNPFVIAAALVAREVSMWSGAAIAARGRRMKARNVTAREDYERAAAAHRAEYERGFAPA